MKHAWLGSIKYCLLTGLIWGVFAVPAHAATVSYFLDQSNENTLLPDGNNYLMVTMSDDVAGQVDFTVETIPGAFTQLSNFGIQSFGFNVTGITTPSSFVLPTGWSANTAGANQDGFGNFNIVVSGAGSNREDPLQFSVATSGGISNFFAPSSGTAGEGNVAFAAHVTDFSITGSTVTSAYFGGSTVVPVPAAVWLFGSGLLGLVGVARRKRS